MINAAIGKLNFDPVFNTKKKLSSIVLPLM